MRSRGREEVHFGGAGRARTGGSGSMVRTYVSSTLWDAVNSTDANVDSVASYVAYGGGVWVASDGVLATMSRSTDRVTWTTHSFPNATEKCGKGKLYGNGVFLCFGHLSTATARSTDGGVTWSAGGTIPAGTGFPSVWYGNGVWMGIANFGSVPFKSTDDGVSWTTVTATGGSARQIVYCNGVWICARDSSASYDYSTDNGATWNVGTFPGTYVAISASDKMFMVLAGSPSTSVDGVNWTPCKNIGFRNVNGGNPPEFCSLGGDSWFVPCNLLDATDFQISYNNGYSWATVPNNCATFPGAKAIAGGPDGTIHCAGSGAANKLTISKRNIIEVTE